jgi:hypothetical protein
VEDDDEDEAEDGDGDDGGGEEGEQSGPRRGRRTRPWLPALLDALLAADPALTDRLLMALPEARQPGLGEGDADQGDDASHACGEDEDGRLM